MTGHPQNQTISHCGQAFSAILRVLKNIFDFQENGYGLAQSPIEPLKSNRLWALIEPG